MSRSCWLVLLLWIISTVDSFSFIDIRRIPNQFEQLKSGDNIVLVCTVTTNTLTTVQWFNGTTPLNGDGDGVIITLPYRLNNATWQAAMELVVLTVYSSGWYYCKPDDLSFGSIQLNVQDSAEDVFFSLTYTTVHLYATVPFTINCTSTVPAENKLHMEILWYRNDDKISSLDNSFTIHQQNINLTTVESQMTVIESLPIMEVEYKCILRASSFNTVIYTIDKSTPTLQIKGSPLLTLTLSSTPDNGPLFDSAYILTCTGVPSVNASTVTLQWIDSNDAPVLTGENIVVGEMENGMNGSYYVNLTVTELSEDNENTYTCSGSMELHEYPNHQSIKSTISSTVVAPVQITNTIISALPMNALDWYEGSDAVLICTIETNKATSDGLIVEWSNSNGAINTGNFTSSLSDIVHQSVLELKSLSVHSDVYYCKASIAGAGIKQDWHYVNVESNFPSISISLTSLSVPVVGTSHTLHCSSTKPDSIQGQPTIAWTRSNGAVIAQDSWHIITDPLDNGTHFVSDLLFISVEYSDADEYICEVEYDLFGLSQTVQRSDTTLMKVQVAPPMVTITASSEGLDCNVQVDFSPSVSISTVWWYLVDNSYRSLNATAIPGIQASELSVLNCYEEYEVSLTFEDVDYVWNEYRSVSCLVNVSSDLENVVSSLFVATVDFESIQEKVPVRPSNVTIGSTGSHWAEVSWISADDDVTSSNFHIEYHQNGAEDGTMLSTNRIFPLLAECNMYSAIITDLIPASKYFFKVIVKNRNSANESEVKEFTTNEAVPTGIPLNLSYLFLRDGAVQLTWSPPRASDRNGIITDYSVSCDPTLGQTNNERQSNSVMIVSQMNVSLYGIMINATYQCDVAAINAEGVGPLASLQFSLSMLDTGIGAVTESVNFLESNIYSIAALAIVGIILVVIIASLAVSVCYYKRKLKLYFQHVCKGAPSSPPDSPTRHIGQQLELSDRYVPSDVIGSMFERATHRYTAVNRQTSTTPLEEELKRMDSEV